MKQVVTRIAPSPTGDMHIGTARTALFNYLYAKHMGGKFMLRVEDTDKERSTNESVQVILDGLKWLGLPYDGFAVYQSQNFQRHLEVAFEMVARGAAYFDFMTPEDTEAWKAANKGKAFRSTWRDVPAPADDGLKLDPYVIRLKVPLGEDIVVNDLVKGQITFKTDVLDDIVLLRGDGSPIYNLAVVVDDHDMGVTHVIRGDDHINNTPRQMLIYRAMDWELPEFGHLPLIHNEQGKKYSKRDGAASVMDFADAGYLPETMRNYLARLGWGHGDDEIFSDAQAIEWFDVADVVSSPARFNPKKLLNMNHHYIGKLDGDGLAKYVLPLMNKRGIWLRVDIWRGHFENILVLFRDNAHTLNELADVCEFVFRKPAPDDKAKAVLTDPVNRALLDDVNRSLLMTGHPEYPRLWATTPESAVMVGDAVKIWAAAKEVPMKTLGPVMRAALTGRTVAPDVGTLLVALGAREARTRLLTAYSTMENL